GTQGRDAEGLAIFDSAIAIARSGPDSIEAPAYLTAQRVPLLLRLGRPTDATQAITFAEGRLGPTASVTVAHRADINRYAGMIDYATGHPERAAERFRLAVGFVPNDLHACLLGLARTDTSGDACSRYASLGTADPLILTWITRAREK